MSLQRPGRGYDKIKMCCERILLAPIQKRDWRRQNGCGMTSEGGQRGSKEQGNGGGSGGVTMQKRAGS